MKTKVLFLLLSFFVILTSNAQQNKIYKEINENNTISFLRFNEQSRKPPLENYEKLLRDSLKLNKETTFKLTKTEDDKLGFKHLFFSQYYNGVKIEFGTYTVHGRKNLIDYISGNYLPITRLNITPKISGEDALNYAKKIIGAKKYMWEDDAEEKLLKENDGKESTYYPKPELVVIKDIFLSNSEYRLAYKMNIYAMSPLTRKIYYIDASNGALLYSDELIKHANTPGTADTRYSGTQAIVGDSFNGSFRLRESRNGVSIQTLNMNNGTNYAGATDFTDNDNNWTSAEHNNSNRDNAALDAHWAAENVYDYFYTVHGRNSWNNAGGSLLNYVHSDLIGMGDTNNDNAFWDGSRMTYGDGTSSFSPLTSLDVVAHELGHGITSSTVNLAYNKESGALNEGFSDIWAACVEAAYAPTKQRWQIGEDISLFGIPLRAMDHPKTGSLSNQPNTYGGINWVSVSGCTPNKSNDYCGVHTNSGVLNFWFYLLTDGGNGTNDINNSYSVTGIGISDASKIAYRTLTVTLSNAQATFANARVATIQAAIDLFGSGSCQEINTTNAWYAVGVGAAYSGNLSVSGPSQFCTTAAYSVPNLPGGATVTWSANPSNIVSISTSNNVATVTRIGNGIIDLLATFNTSCGIISVPAKVSVGTYIAGDFPIIGQTNICSNTVTTYNVNSLPGATNYNWIIPPAALSSGWYIIAGQGTPVLTVNTGSNSATIKLKVSNNCGESTAPSNLFVNVNCGSFKFVASPNPTSNTLTVSQNNASTQMQAKTSSLDQNIVYGAFSIKILDQNAKILKNLSSERGEEITIDTSDIPNGTYFLHISQNKEVIKKQIIVQH